MVDESLGCGENTSIGACGQCKKSLDCRRERGGGGGGGRESAAARTGLRAKDSSSPPLVFLSEPNCNAISVEILRT